MGFLLDFHGGSLEFLGFHKDVYGIPAGFLFDFHEISMEYLWNFYGMSMVFLWDFFGIPKGIP